MAKKANWLLGVMLLLAVGGVTGYFTARCPWLHRSRQSGLIGETLPEPYHEAVGNPAERELYADLYVQTAAEYRALCLQTYRQAHECLLRRLADPPAGDLPFAVIMDLDETVLDNSGYQSWAYRNGETFDDKNWAAWEQASNAGEVGLVPGAREFIEKVEKLTPPVKVFYVSNRRDKAGTLAVLARLKLDSEGVEQRLFLRTSGREKEPRRKEIEKGHRVLLLVGDNLMDLSSDFEVRKINVSDYEQQRNVIQARLDRVERHKERFGHDWIILPNPVYGDWTNPLGDDPSRHLRPTKFTPFEPRTED